MSSGAERSKDGAAGRPGVGVGTKAAADRRAAEDAADREAARDARIAGIVEPTGALAAYLHAKRTAQRLRRAAEDGRLSHAAASSPGFRGPLVAAVAVMALQVVIGLGGTLFGWAAPSATARAVEAVRGLLGALDLPGGTPWLPAARGMAACWAERGAANRGVVFAAAADASALLSLALVPLIVPPLWATTARRRSGFPYPSDPEILRGGRLYGAVVAAFGAVLIWYGAHLLVYGDLDPGRSDAGRFGASSFAPIHWALMAICVPGFVVAWPSFVVAHVIRPPAR